MKKLFSLILALCTVFSVFSAVIPTASATYGYLLGDVDDDSRVTAKDLLLLKKYLNMGADARDLNMLAANVDKDEKGVVSNPDLLSMKKLILGLSDTDGNNTDKRYKLDTLTVGGKNISRYCIVIPETAPLAFTQAAKELRSYISRACGITLNTSYSYDETQNYAITYKLDETDEYELGKEGYNVTVAEDGNITFTCGTMRGCLYATYYFLEEFVGYRFLTDNIVYLYDNDTVDIATGFTETEVPVLSYRAVSQTGVSRDYARTLRDNCVDGATVAAGTEEYGYGVGTLFIHAHSYEYQCNIGATEQPCLTSEKTYEQIITYNCKLIDEREARGQHLGTGWTQISCSPNDSTNFCTCEACKSIYAKESSIAGTIFRMSNRVAEYLDGKYPGIEIFTIAYWDARNPPSMTRPRENVCVCFCIGGCNNHSYDDWETCEALGGNPRLQSPGLDGTMVNSSNAVDMKELEKWSELTNNIYIWYYAVTFHYSLAPSPNVFNVYNDFKYLVDTDNIEGIYSEGGGRYCFELLRGYLISKMMWNPNMSEEEFENHINEYLMIYYGNGWEYIREYLEMSHHAGDLNGCWTNNFDRPFNMYNEEYFKENYHYMADLFDKAIAATDDPTQKDRIAICSLQCDFLGLSATFESEYNDPTTATEKSRAAYVKNYTDFYNTVEERNIRICGGDGKHGCENFPKDSSTIMKPVEWMWEGCTGYWIYSNGRYI